MDAQTLLDNIDELSDLELAVLLSLVNQGHCLLITDDDLVDDLASELALIVAERFGLSYAVLNQDELSSAEPFCEAILEQEGRQFGLDENKGLGSLRARLASVDIRAAPRPNERHDSSLDDRVVKNVIIAKGFNLADKHIQVQALELIYNRRMFSKTTVHVVPKTFLFLPIVTASSQNIRLTPHLNDRIFISHYHSPQDGFANLEDLDKSHISDDSSNGPKQRLSWESTQQDRKISSGVIEKLRLMGEATSYTPETRRYLQDIVTFLRLERGVDGGVTPRASVDFLALAKSLAPLHGIDFMTPSLVALAARKVFAHRVVIAEPQRERSMQYGSDLSAVHELLEDLTPQEVIENVLAIVPLPM